MSVEIFRLIGAPYDRCGHQIQHFQDTTEAPKENVSIQRFNWVVVVSLETWLVMDKMTDSEFLKSMAELRN